MKILNLQQGTPDWLAARAKHFCASEAAAMMGVSKYMTRDELLRQKHTGEAQEVDEQKQKLFDRGHETEAAARKIIEEMLGEELYPITATDDDGFLLASSDGVTMGGDVGFEHKLWNKDLVKAVQSGEIPESHYWQLEHQILVLGLDKVRFTVSDGTPGNLVWHDYTPQPGRAAKLLAGWKQFQQDLANYQHVEVLPPVTAAPVKALPALSIQVNGAISLFSNLDAFGAKLQEFVDGINKSPSDDQAFADAEAAVKTLQTAQDALDAAEKAALAQTASIDDMRNTVGMYRDLARNTRLTLEKIVKARKETIREEIRKGGIDAFAAHIAALNTRFDKPYMPAIPADFNGVMKGKKTLASLRDAVNTELARAKIEANAVADRIDVNRKVMKNLCDPAILFPDFAQVCTKQPDDFAALVAMRVTNHKEAEQKKQDELREKIRLEEEAKANVKAQATIAAAATPAPAAPAVLHPVSQVPAVGSGVLSSPAPKPKLVSSPTGPRPTDDNIILILSQHYKVHTGIVIGWLGTMDLKAAAERHAEQLMSA